MIGHVSVAGTLIHLTILLAALVGGMPFSTTIAMIIAAIIGIAELSFTGMMAVYGMTGFVAGALQPISERSVLQSVVLSVSVFFLLYDLTLPLDSSHFVTIGVATLIIFFDSIETTRPIRHVLLSGNTGSIRKTSEMVGVNAWMNNWQTFNSFPNSCRHLSAGVSFI